MIEKFVKVRPLQAADYEKLKAKVEADKHVLYFPTHIVEKEGEIIGYLSLGSIPMCLVWMDTNKAKAFDSVQTLNVVENIIRAQNVGAMAVPCATDSPFFEYMTKLGFLQLSDMALFAKNL